MQLAPRSKRVLIADDYPGAAESLAHLLAVASPEPIEASYVLDGEHAVDLALASKPDMAVLDIEMPGMDGVEAALAMRSALGADVPLLVALTGNQRRAGDASTLAAFDHALLKPADLDKLLALLASLG